MDLVRKLAIGQRVADLAFMGRPKQVDDAVCVIARSLQAGRIEARRICKRLVHHLLGDAGDQTLVGVFVREQHPVATVPAKT